MILIQAIRNAMVNDLAVRNVADLAAVPTGKPGRPSRSLNLEQALAVLDAAEGERLWPYVAVSMLGGIRPEEARALLLEVLRAREILPRQDGELVAVARDVELDHGEAVSGERATGESDEVEGAGIDSGEVHGQLSLSGL